MISEKIDCEICSSQPAKLVMVRRHGEDLYRTFVCEKCASERVRMFSGGGLSIEKVVERVSNLKETSSQASYSCRFCGTTLADIVVDGKPGCCLCYARFAGEIEEAVIEAQGCTYHIGKTHRL